MWFLFGGAQVDMGVAAGATWDAGLLSCNEDNLELLLLPNPQAASSTIRILGEFDSPPAPPPQVELPALTLSGLLQTAER